MKKFDFLMICLLSSFTSYSQTNKELAKEETIKITINLTKTVRVKT